jgi:hypothetical protein
VGARLRTSIGVPSSWEQWTLDEVAMNDIPAMIDAVLRDRNRQPQVDVVRAPSARRCSASVLAGRLARGADAADRHTKRCGAPCCCGRTAHDCGDEQNNARLIGFPGVRRVKHVDSSIEREARTGWTRSSTVC